MKRTNSRRTAIFNFFAAQRNKNNLESDTDSGSASEEINIDLHASEQGEVEQTPNDICIDSSSRTDDLENLQIDELGNSSCATSSSVSSQPQVPVTTTAVGEYSKPNHADVKEIPGLKRRTQAVRFQKKWFDSYPWLHYQPSLQGVLCWTCIKAEGMRLLRSNSKKDPAFLSKGFRNWKKATETYEGHQVSDTHRTAAVKLQASRAPSVCVVIDEGLRKRQEAPRHCLLRIFSCVKYLLRQGLPFRGLDDKSGNFSINF